MIKVERIAKPQILKNKEKEWLIAYEAALNAYKSNPTESNKLKKKTTESKYNHESIKAALKKMFFNKCAYCESHITHVSFGDIEHYRPKLRFPNKCFDWDNFLLGCGICNSMKYKGDNFPETHEGGPFVNPVTENPDDFFSFEFDPNTGTANVIPKNERGRTTEMGLGLNRIDLVKHRSLIVKKMAFIAIKASQGDAKCLNEICSYCGNEDEYSAFARALVKRFNLAC
jgi:uncharacterized protein (TIGR02646 family)